MSFKKMILNKLRYTKIMFTRIFSYLNITPIVKISPVKEAGNVTQSYDINSSTWTYTATANLGWEFKYWTVNGVIDSRNPITIPS